MMETDDQHATNQKTSIKSFRSTNLSVGPHNNDTYSFSHLPCPVTMFCTLNHGSQTGGIDLATVNEHCYTTLETQAQSIKTQFSMPRTNIRFLRLFITIIYALCLHGSLKHNPHESTEAEQ